MGKLIGSGNTENFGEKLFIDKVQEYLDDTNIIYWNRQVFGREFDVCILMPGKGILVVELKGWREENILRVENNDHIIIRTDDGEEPASPQNRQEATVFLSSATFARTSANSLLCTKWFACRRFLKLSLDPAVWMWSWKRSLPFSKRTW